MANKSYFVLITLFHVIPLGFVNARGEDFGKVMPLGDSITYGANTPGGYRDPLYQLLIAEGHTLQYVGTQSDNTTPLLIADGRQRHEGHGGYTIFTTPPEYQSREGIYEHITDWMATTDPDVILLMIGTNDCGLNYDIPNVDNRLDALVERIFTNKPSVRLLLATVVPAGSALTEANVETLNTQMPAIVANHQSLGRNIQLVPMWDALEASDLYDGVHPDRGGYRKMAKVWFESMTTGIPPVGNNPDIVLSGQNASGAAGSGAEGTYSTNILAGDLVNNASPTLDSWTRGDVSFELDTLNDGGGTLGFKGTYVPATYNDGYLPCTYTYKLKTSPAPYGYDITEIRTYAGYPSNGPCLANQKYAMLVDYVDGNPDFVWIGNFEYTPFSNSDSDPAAATKVTLTSNTGTLASWVSRIRFVLLDHGYDGIASGVHDGSIYHEIDVLGQPSSTPPPVGAHWPFNDNAGSVAADASGNGYDGQLRNMDQTAWVAGKQCGGLSFDGGDDYVQIIGYKGITGKASRTCMAWIKTSSVSGEILTWGSEPGNGARWIIRVNEGGQLRAEVRGGNIIGTSLINDGQWHHIAVVLEDDGSPNINEARFYVDGSPETISSSSDEPVNTSSDTADQQEVRIGVYGPLLRYFQGLIDEVRIYNCPLSATDIQEIYQQYALAADTEPDGDIDLADFAILSGSWQAPSCQTDLTCDCIVDLDDLAVLIDEWLDSI